jgi:hypothetical protein
MSALVINGNSHREHIPSALPAEADIRPRGWIISQISLPEVAGLSLEGPPRDP